MNGERHYDNPETHERHVARYSKAINLVHWPGGVWLDCACGSGYGTVMMPGDRVVGIDCSPEAIEYAEKHHPGPLYIRAFCNGAMWTLKEHDITPDVIISVETLEHLNQREQGIWVADVADGISENGVFVVSCPMGKDAPSLVNPWHLHEPSVMGLAVLLKPCFEGVEITLDEPYVDTFAKKTVQMWARCTQPIRRQGL